MPPYPRIVWTPQTGIELRLSRQDEPIMDGTDEVIPIRTGDALNWAGKLINCAQRELARKRKPPTFDELAPKN
jgi:hypothetical protein